MLKTFKLRVFMSLLIVAMAGISIRTPENQDQARAVMQFVLKDYGIQQRLLEWASGWMDYPDKEAIPAISPRNIQIPCEFLYIEQNFGWKRNPKTGLDEFFPGIRFKVEDNSLVKPIMDGQVVEVGDGPEGRTVTVLHSNNVSSSYAGLEEVLVKKEAIVTSEQVLGKSGTHLYLEIRGASGPINPQIILE